MPQTEDNQYLILFWELWKKQFKEKFEANGYKSAVIIQDTEKHF